MARDDDICSKNKRRRETDYLIHKLQSLQIL